MQEGTLVLPVTCIIGFLFIAAISTMVLRRIHFPYTIGLVVVGIGVGIAAAQFDFLKPIQNMQLTPDIILYVLLPTIVFDTAVNIDSRLLLKTLSPVMILAAPGLIISTLLIGTLASIFTPLTISSALLFGALISATDPIAVVALFKELGTSKRLTMLVDGESLFNDATAIVAFQIIKSIVAAGSFGAFVIFSGTLKFITVFSGGIIVGIVVGWLIVFILRFSKNDPLIEIALSTVAAYAAFIIANFYLNVSGVMSVVGAGMAINWFGAAQFSERMKKYLHEFWAYAAFIANSFVFLLLGLTENYMLTDLQKHQEFILPIIIAIIIVLIARAVVIYGLVPFVNMRHGSKLIDIKQQTIIFWGGLRGAVPLALALSLPQGFEHRKMIVEITLGVVLFTLLVQGTTMSHLIRKLKLKDGKRDRHK